MSIAWMDFINKNNVFTKFSLASAYPEWYNANCAIWQRNKIMHIARVPLRQLHDNLRLAIPGWFCEQLGLRAGDYVDLVQDNGDVKLRFVKVEPPVKMEAAE